MVELDVQLTKDLVPVIYHDYYVNIAMKKVRTVKDLTMTVKGEIFGKNTFS